MHFFKEMVCLDLEEYISYEPFWIEWDTSLKNNNDIFEEIFK